MSAFDSEFWSIVGLSLRVSSLAVLLSSLAGIPLGVWLGISRFRGKGILSSLIYSAMALPPVVVGLFLYLLLSRSGPLAILGWLYTPAAMTLAQTILALPFVVGITMNAVESVPRELAWQIRSLGASPWQCRWAILREARHGVWLAVATAFGRSISEVGAVLIVGGDIREETRVLTTAIVFETRQGSFAAALLLGAVLLTVAMLVNLLILRLRNERPSS